MKEYVKPPFLYHQAGKPGSAYMKEYIKPEIVVLEIRPEERFASNSNNCHAERGKKSCAPAGLWSHGNPFTP